MQDPNVTPWGALDRYQAHFIVDVSGLGKDGPAHGPRSEVFAKTRPVTSGRFASKRVESVSWEGSSHPLLVSLNQDVELNESISRQTPWDASIYVEQTGDNVRIHGRWKDSAGFGISQEMFEIYDRIAGHVKKSCLPPV